MWPRRFQGWFVFFRVKFRCIWVFWWRQCAKEIHCKHFQIVFTSPAVLRTFWRWNRKLFTNLYLRAAWHVLRDSLAEPRWLGALPGVTAVFQSWGDELQEHLHLHFIVTCGGLSPTGEWIEADPEFLIPIPILAARFRDTFLAYLSDAFEPKTVRGKRRPEKEVLVPPPRMSVEQCRKLFKKLRYKKWHLRIDPAYEHATGVMKYIGRYIRRGPLSERRVVAYDGKTVTIAYAHPKKHKTRTFILDAKEFILRLLNHAPEKGTHCVRVYGLYHSTKLRQLNQARALFGQDPYIPSMDLPDTHELLHRMFPDFTGDLCPHCHCRLETIFVVRHSRSPPQEVAA